MKCYPLTGAAEEVVGPAASCAMRASRRSSRPLPSPSRSHSPPTSFTRSVAGSRSVIQVEALSDPWTLAAPEESCACACGMPITLGRCGGGSFDCVKLESGSVDAGADERRSVYDMNESLFDAFFGDGGACEANPPLMVVGAVELIEGDSA